MRSRSNRSRKQLCWIDECSGIGSKVEKELSKRVQDDKRGSRVFFDCIVSRSQDGENNGKHDKAHDLDGFASPLVDESNSEKVAGYISTQGNNKLAKTGSPYKTERRRLIAEINGGKDDRSVEVGAIVANI